MTLSITISLLKETCNATVIKSNNVRDILTFLSNAFRKKGRGVSIQIVVAEQCDLQFFKKKSFYTIECRGPE